MSPQVEAAWIALLGVVLGIGGTVIVAIVGFRSTRNATKAANAAALATVREQIEADRRNRIWEKQAVAYTDGIAVTRYRMTFRQAAMRQMLTGAKPDLKPSPVDQEAVNARLIAYASPGVLRALLAATRATEDFKTAILLWAAAMEQAKLMADSRLPSPGTASERDAAEKALKVANRLDDVLMDTIRHELHAGTDRQPAPPVPQVRSAPDRTD